MAQPEPLTPSCCLFVQEAKPDYNDTIYTITNMNILENASEDNDDSNFYQLMFIKVLYWKLAKPNRNKGYTHTTKGKK